MSRAILNWRNLPYAKADFFTKGTEFAQAIVPDTFSRFAICEARGGRDNEGNPTLVYRLRDAHTVNDADIRAGKRPAIVGVFAEPDEAAAMARSMVA